MSTQLTYAHVPHVHTHVHTNLRPRPSCLPTDRDQARDGVGGGERVPLNGGAPLEAREDGRQDPRGGQLLGIVRDTASGCGTKSVRCGLTR